jgi:predicted nucleotide-binding protein
MPRGGTRTPSVVSRPALQESDPEGSKRKLLRRLAELESISSATVVVHDDARISNAERNIVSDIREIFGEGSTEYQSNQYFRLWRGPEYLDMTPTAMLESRLSAIPNAKLLVESLIQRLDERIDASRNSSSGILTSPQAPESSMPDARKVFIVHGRDNARNSFFFDLLRRVGLNPMEFDDAIALTGSGSPYIGDVVAAALSNAMAIVVLFTGDDVVNLRPGLVGDHEASELAPTLQPRPNVILEAGMALAMAKDRTIIVEVPPLRAISDLQGVHVVRFTNGDGAERNRLIGRLRTAGCEVTTTGSHWLELPFPR